MKAELFPLEKLVLDGHDIFLGQSKEQFISVLGEAEYVRENYGGGSWRYYYFDSELAFDVDKKGNIQFIEFLGGHDGELKPVIYGVSAFDVSTKKLVKLLTEHNNGEIDDSWEDSYGFLAISVGIWQTADDEEYWTTIGIGGKDYYSNDEE